MIAVKLALFFLSLNLAFSLISLANIPTGECQSMTDCGKTWQKDITDTWSTEVKADIDSGKYTTTQVQEGQFQNTDIFSTITNALQLFGSFLVGVLDGGYHLTSMVLCNGNECMVDTPPTDYQIMANYLANIVRYITYIVYSLGIIQLIRGMNIEK